MNEVKNKPKGDIKVIMHKGGKYDIKTGTIIGGEVLKTEEDHNLIVNNASLLIAGRMAPPNLNSDNGIRYDYGLQCLAIGYDSENHGEDVTNSKLFGEIYRKKFDDWGYVHVVEDNKELKKDMVSNQIQYVTTFEANIPPSPDDTNDSVAINEMGLFGGDCVIENGKPAIVDNETKTGIMFNYKTFSTWSKPSEAQMTIIWTITY